MFHKAPCLFLYFCFMNDIIIMLKLEFANFIISQLSCSHYRPNKYGLAKDVTVRTHSCDS